jgi:hypothetical protein
MRHVSFPALWLAVAAVLTSPPARAGSFDPSGSFAFDPSAIVTNGFDDLVSPPDGVKLVLAPGGIQGAGYLSVDTQKSSASFDVALPSSWAQKDASYVARVFARTNRINATIDISYADSGSPSFSARFFPTGTVTSDGWYEVATNEFSVQGSRQPQTTFTVYASGADVDALEIVPQGNFKALAACSPPIDSACGAHEFCVTGWCRDGNPLVPPLPQSTDRTDAIAYFKNRMSLFFGGLYSRQNYLPNALATLDTLQSAPDAWTFWNGIVTAIHRLHDWHTTVNAPFGFGGRGLFPVCFVEGDADLSHVLAPKDPSYFDVLVSHVGPKGTNLIPGDRLVAINGMHPIAFVESLEALDWGIWRADDPDTHAESIERMIGVIRRWATTITTIHCDPQSKTCAAPVTTNVADLPFDDGTYLYPYCDHRPAYHLGSNGPDPQQHNSWAGPFYGAVEESQTGEDIWGMVWNDAYVDPSSGNGYQAAYDALDANAKAVILDHRVGNGGDVLGAEFLTSLWRPLATIAAATPFDQTVGEWDAFTSTVGKQIYNASLAGGAYEVGSATANTKRPVALMIARDGSASDWFPLGMQNASPNVRIFGRHTAGAFSSYFDWDYYGGLSWRMASGDLMMPDGSTHLGKGAQPDEEIVPRQSDLLGGIDTVYARALDWVRTCTACRQ